MESFYQDEIFSGIRQVDWYIGKQKFQYPVFFKDIQSFGAFFPARISDLKKLLPDIRFSPVRILPGIGLISLHAVDFRDKGFHGLSIAIVLNNPIVSKIPPLNIITQIRHANIYVYVLYHLVTTEIAGILLSQCPSIPTPLVSMEYSRKKDRIICIASEDNNLICMLKGNIIRTESTRLMKSFCHHYENAQPQSWEFKLNALEYGTSFARNDIELKLGTHHPIARILSKALLPLRAFMYISMPRVQAVLYGPERLQASNLRFMLHDRMGFQISKHMVEARKIQEKRFHDRDPADMPAEIVGEREGENIHEGVRVINLSRGGMYVKSEIPLAIGTRVSASLEDDRFDNTFWIKGKVVRKTRQTMAIQFTESIYDEE